MERVEDDIAACLLVQQHGIGSDISTSSQNDKDENTEEAAVEDHPIADASVEQSSSANAWFGSDISTSSQNDKDENTEEAAVEDHPSADASVEQSSSANAWFGTSCCFHDAKDKVTPGKVNQFTDKTLSKCKNVLDIRKSGNLKYSNTVLPDSADDSIGFHMECYRKFVALPKSCRSHQPKDCSSDEAGTSRLLRSDLTVSVSNPRTDVLLPVCIICEKARRKFKNQEQKLVLAVTGDFEKKLRKFASWLNDQRLLLKMATSDFTCKEVRYHAICRTEYQREAEATAVGRKENRGESVAALAKGDQFEVADLWQKERRIHKEAFRATTAWIEENILKLPDVARLADINNQYQALVRELGGKDFCDAQPSAQKLELKILKHFGNQIRIEKGTTKRGNIVCSASLTPQEVLKKLGNLTDIDAKLRDVAYLLRNAIMKAEHKPLPEEMTLDVIKNGEVTVPPILHLFFSHLVGGPDSRVNQSAARQRRIQSICEDTVFSVTAGKKKPGKHLQLGLALKSLTGSKKVVTMMNRLGHCASYDTIEEVETEMTIHANSVPQVTPSGMKLSPDQGTGVAWDNFDRFVETSTGKATLHDTVGIAYQLVSDDTETILCTEKDDLSNADSGSSKSSDTVTVPTKNRRKRSLGTSGTSVSAYRKKPKMDAPFLASDDPRQNRYADASHRQLSRKKDFLWMAARLDHTRLTPLWVGFQINESPTSNSVVLETMKRSLQIASENGRNSIAVTYDLAIAKKALQIQSAEAPRFDNLFVSLGPFHIEMALFAAIGKLIAESGGPYILSECDILAKGSMESFYRGKCYKRCKRVHEILLLAMEGLHFDQFLLESEDSVEMRATLDREISVIYDSKDIEKHEFTRESIEVFERYQTYTESTLQGAHGKTAQFWGSYIHIVHLYHDLSRSIREGNLPLYVQVLFEIAAYFFALNHLNYARWLLKYIDSLLRLPDSHPEVYEDFSKGMFGIKLTGKSFSSNPIDKTLEQTINADAACQRTGIASMTNSISARRRWAQSHFLRTSIISNLFDHLGMNGKEDVTLDLKPHRMRNDNYHVRMMKERIKETMNPFDAEIDQTRLYNIASGKAAKESTEHFLLSRKASGEEARDKFLEECRADPKRFEQKISKQKVCTFATESIKRSVKSKDAETATVTLVRDLFGSVLFHSLQKKIDMGAVLAYPLTPVPLSLCHVDGTMMKTPKSTLLSSLESRIVTVPPESIDVYVIDAMVHLFMHSDLPIHFGRVADYILRSILDTTASVVHFVSDRYVEQSIKSAERHTRDEHRAPYQIMGAAQNRPSNWREALKNPSFKEELINFLTTEWCDERFSSMLGAKILFANCSNICYQYSVVSGKVERREVAALYTTREEADERMFVHVASISGPANIVLRTVDTDCLVVAIGTRSKMSDSLRLWLEVGHQSNNTLRYISIDQLCSNLGASLSTSLLAYHALTGCDYTASFHRKGKVKPFKLLEREQTFQECFSKLSSDTFISEKTHDTVEAFVCAMYGQPKLKSVNEVRLQAFLDKYKPKRDAENITDVKKLDASSMPPCQRVLHEKIKRTHFIARRWFSCTEQEVPEMQETDYGWTLGENGLEVCWFEGDMAPKDTDIVVENATLETHVECKEYDDESDESENDLTDGSDAED